MKHLTRFSIFKYQYLYSITIISHNATSHRIILIHFPSIDTCSNYNYNFFSLYLKFTQEMFIISRRLESIMRSSRINFDRTALIIWDRDAPERGGDDGGRRGRSNGGESTFFRHEEGKKEVDKLGRNLFQAITWK